MIPWKYLQKPNFVSTRNELRMLNRTLAVTLALQSWLHQKICRRLLDRHAGTQAQRCLKLLNMTTLVFEQGLIGRAKNN